MKKYEVVLHDTRPIHATESLHPPSRIIPHRARENLESTICTPLWCGRSPFPGVRRGDRLNHRVSPPKGAPSSRPSLAALTRHGYYFLSARWESVRNSARSYTASGAHPWMNNNTSVQPASPHPQPQLSVIAQRGISGGRHLDYRVHGIMYEISLDRRRGGERGGQELMQAHP
ncbi:hypothetical protein BO71DRAFT_160825 [Aspergillus ellipticus CBS 707.79]|uniref:Uncharacterized protein n=1 Tax=Aspergillus ellipticus CBS 707.79 TaxID=1448320 RepID=A0A319DH79_9EURO|nr:hypothetical protein BO71DRAFT_160825 [Aspergillus ellipticus CBS 707.79]